MTRGRRPLPWIKLWLEMLNDTKMNRLSAAEKWCWIGILLLAGQPPERGKLLLTETEPMTLEDIASALRLTPEEIPLLENCISKLIDLKSLKWNDHCLEVINFKKRQEVYKSDLPADELTPNSLRILSELTPTEGEGRGETKDSTPSPNGKGGSKKRASSKTNSGVKGVLDEMKSFLVCGGEAVPAIEENSAMTADRRIDPIPNYGKEGKAIKRMLDRGFTREEILACWRSKVSQRGGEFVSMTWVNEDIRSKGGTGGKAERHFDPDKPLPRKQISFDPNKPIR